MSEKWYERKLEQYGWYSNFLPRTARYKFNEKMKKTSKRRKERLQDVKLRQAIKEY